MLWQLAHVTSFSWCLPDTQNARFRLLAWHVEQTEVRWSAVPSLANALPVGYALVGSFRCSAALPWHAWHMLPSASLFAPCGDRSIEFHWA